MGTWGIPAFFVLTSQIFTRRVSLHIVLTWALYSDVIEIKPCLLFFPQVVKIQLLGSLIFNAPIRARIKSEF